MNWASVDPVIQATKDILGEDQIYYMIVYKPLQRSSAFRLWCKAHGFNIDDYDECGKMLSDKHFSDEEVKERFPTWAKQIDDSVVFRGVVESMSPSPCSFLLSNDPISEQIGLIRVGDEKKKGDYVMCCTLDGYNCDVYKFLKNDYLTVSVYEIIRRVYELIGRPIDDISTLVNNCDDKVWAIYKNGLTTTINQADSDSGKRLVSDYSPQNLAELAAWVAAIRPGFASLLDNFINRKPYTTGVEELDNLLSDSFNYMLYQESIMTYLVWLGIEEKETYDIIKKISKKKFKQLELDALKDKLLTGWKDRVGTEDGFENTWQVVNDAAHYSFNASHALSVAIDSLYGAYLKSHYPLEYFTVVLSMYSDDIDRTAKLTNELKAFNIKLNDIRFGKSVAEYAMDKESNSIYKGLSGIKYLNNQIAQELFDLSKNKYNSFIELLNDIHNKTIVNSRQLEILTLLNFFEDFGKNGYLLEVEKLYDNIANRKQFKKSDLEKIGIPDYLMKKYSGKETEKIYKDVDTTGVLIELVTTIKNEPVNIKTQIQSEIEYLGYCNSVRPDIEQDYYIVLNYRTYKNPRKPYFRLRNLHDGHEIDTKIKDARLYEERPFGEYSVIYVYDLPKVPKKKLVDGKWIDSEELELVLRDYDVVTK